MSTSKTAPETSQDPPELDPSALDQVSGGDAAQAESDGPGGEGHDLHWRRRQIRRWRRHRLVVRVLLV